MPSPPKFEPGFRLSRIDIAILVFGGALSIWIALFDLRAGLAIGWVVSHFFLFCNVLRLARPLELIWAGCFALLSVCCVSVEVIAWPIVFGASGLLTVILSMIQLRRPGYHGVGWQQVNPCLPEWWARRIAASHVE